MTERRFPDNHEIDQWISSYFLDGNDASPVLDQLKAAASDVSRRGSWTALSADVLPLFNTCNRSGR